MNNDRLLDQLKRRIQQDRRGFNVLSGRTEPGTDSCRVRPRLMFRMVLSMAHAWRSHSRVYQHETDQEEPNKPGLF